MRRLLLLPIPLLVACSNYWEGTFSGRYTISTTCPPQAATAQDVSGDLVMKENETHDDTIDVTVLASANDANGDFVSGSQCIGLTAITDSDEARFSPITCPKSDPESIDRSVTGGTMSIDGNKVTFSLTIESPNQAEDATGTCVQTFTGSFDRSSYRTTYY